MSEVMRNFIATETERLDLMKKLETEGVKYDGAKPRVDLFPSEALIEISKVLTYGANKYAAHNWRKGMDWSRLISATMRHLAAFNGGENIDPESNQLHLAHAGCDIAFLIAYQVSGLGTDDRYKKE